MVFLGKRGAEYRDHGIAGELHDGPAGLEDGVVHCGAVLIELADQNAGISALGDGGVPPDVRHQNRDIEFLRLADSFAFAPQLVTTNPWNILNPNAWSATEAGTTNTACGIGPYTIESFTEGEETVFVANPTYYGNDTR